MNVYKNLNIYILHGGSWKVSDNIAENYFFLSSKEGSNEISKELSPSTVSNKIIEIAIKILSSPRKKAIHVISPFEHLPTFG